MPRVYRFFSLLLLLATGASLGTHRWSEGRARLSDGQPPELLPTVYANPVDRPFEDTLQAGETLSQLLARSQLAETEAQALVAELAQHQDPRRMRPGSVIALRRSYSDGAVRRMELRLDPDRTLALHRDGEAWRGAVEEVEVRPDTVILSGMIRSSLYQALRDGEALGIPSDERDRVTDILADQIFAWQVDFSRDLREGDRFRILYERLVRPDGTARSGRVLGVQFTINKRDYEAYAFGHDDVVEDYFDREGESLRGAFLRAPLQYRRISSAFSRSRFHPILRSSRPHNGTDYAAAAGTPVRAVANGVVRVAGNGGGYGNLVEISHNRGYATRYAHLQRFAAGVRSGTRVAQGDVIGYVGSTGLATGPHLHYEVHLDGRAIDPSGIRDVVGDPVPRNYRGQFLQIVQAHIASLDTGSPPVLFADLPDQAGDRAGE